MDGNRTQSLRSGLGFRLTSVIGDEDSFCIGQVQGRWDREFADVSRDTRASFPALAGSPSFKVRGGRYFFPAQSASNSSR